MKSAPSIFQLTEKSLDTRGNEVLDAQYRELLQKHHITPIFCSNGTSCGCGFVVGDLFFTSGHVIANMPEPHIIIASHIIPLVKNIQVAYQNNPDDANGYDIAVFKIDGIGSDLEFCSEDIETGMRLDSISFLETNQGTESIFCTADVLGEDMREGNYFGIETSKSLKAGCSGSPVFHNGKVAGIITKGNNNGDNTPCTEELPLNFCFVLSSKAVMSLIESL